MSYAHSFKAIRSYGEQRFAVNSIFLTGDFVGFGGAGSNAVTLIVVSLVSLLFPCVIDATATILSLLRMQINIAVDNARLYGMQRFKRLAEEESEGYHYHCSQIFSGSAPVYLTASELSQSESNSSSNRSSPSLSHMLQENMPMAELVQMYPRTNRLKTFQMHWAVVVRGTTYELVRMENSRRAGLRVSPPGSYSEVNALGLPLRLSWVQELGNTYLSNRQIHSLANKAVHRVENYNPFTHNCQFIWTDELLPKMICQCQDQSLLEVPSEILDWTFRKLFLVTISFFIASVLTLLRDAGIFLFQSRFCSKTNIFGFVCSELSKYYVFFRTLLGDDFREYYSSATTGRPPIPLVDIPRLERQLQDAGVGEMIMDANLENMISKIRAKVRKLEKIKLFADFSDQIYGLDRFYIMAIPLSTVFSCLHRVYSYPVFQFVEAGLAFVAVLKMYEALRLIDLPGFPSLRKCEMQKEMSYIKTE